MRGQGGGGGEHRAVWYVCHDQRPMTSMTIKAAKSASGPPLPTTLPPLPLQFHLLAHSRFSTLSCNLFFSFLFFLCIILFSFTIPFSCCLPKVYWSLTGLALTLLSKREGGAGGKGCQKPTSCLYYRQNSAAATPTTFAFFCSFFVKFTSAIPEIMSNIPRAMPKNKKKPNTNKKSTNKKQKEKTISRNR